MKLRIALWTVLLFALPCAAGADVRLTADSRITAVTVFADRAQVTRKASLQLSPGINLITFEALPQFLAEDSLRAEGKGTGKAIISGLTVKNVFVERIAEKNIRDLEDQIRALQEKIEKIEARRKGLVAQKAFIESIRVGWGERISHELAAGKPTAAELGEAAKFVGEGTGKVEEQIFQADAEKKPLTDRIAALKKQLEQARGERKKQVRTVEVAVETTKAMLFDIELSYVVSQARWEPAYDVRLAADGREAELTYRGMVWQQSGEDWKNVKLALSTASPEIGGAPPELSPWHVSFYVPPRPMMYEPRAAMKSAMPMELAGRAAAMPAPAPEAEAAPEPQEPALPQSALVSEGQSSVLFNIVAPADIPADGTKQATVIAVAHLPVTADFITVPKLSQHVYLKSEVTNDTLFPLLAGAANIFNDTTFTGKETLRTIAAGEKFDLFFGADHQIKVKRESTKVRKEGGLLSSNRVSYRSVVELENLKKRGVTVKVLDQLPIPGNEEIKVSLAEAEPRPSVAKNDGTQIWTVNLAPGEKKRITYEITIEYPKGKEVTGIE
ncbi:mucoidy inhibitor MuiA family protein [Geomesophilobacter sediminis]|uniref:Mucoidy inhibitor MuiA family protein n=1 Tax=Geomesophilobacter sediminis TaxID=2798584 RepID=A0A8J7IW07_9BACT|nr:mucoidy inhibitor MuiA family protein [Geomesophilobacter sediminis]MBJ6723512.1 mucoidy inhibitor MuiA family protein [Geomesophilobacter sediminis]